MSILQKKTPLSSADIFFQRNEKNTEKNTNSKKHAQPSQMQILQLLLQPRQICLKHPYLLLLRRLPIGQAVPPSRLCLHPRLRLSTPLVACRSVGPMVRRRHQLLVPSRQMCRASLRLILSCSPTAHLRLPGGHRRCRPPVLLEELSRDFHLCSPPVITVRACVEHISKFLIV